MMNFFKLFIAALILPLALYVQAAALSKSQVNTQTSQAKALADKQQYSQSLALLSKLESSVLDSYGTALVKQTYAYVYLAQGEEQKAIKAYQYIVDMGDAPQGMEMEAYYNLAKLNVDVSKSSGKSSAATTLADGDAAPVKKAAPRYPRRAAVRGIEGFVVVSFTVDEKGNVVDPKVIEEEPKNTFNRAALQAIKKFKYRPKVVNGQAVPAKDVQNVFRFKLENN